MSDLTRWRAIVKSASCGVTLRGPTLEYVKEVCSACSRYRKLAADADSKFTVNEVSIGGRRVKGICIVNKGRRIFVSISSLEGKPKSRRSRVLAEMRELVGEQVQSYRRCRMRTIQVDFSCPLSGVDMRVSDTHVDHTVPFVRLAETWADEAGVNLDTLTLVKLKKLASGWREYHRKHAVLQLVSAKANLQKGCKVE